MAICLLAGVPGSASAQVAANVTLATSNMFRGESTSDEDGAASVEVSVDSPAGLFAGASVTVTGGETSPHYHGATQYAGYAAKRGWATMEVGVVHRDYEARSLFDEAYRPHYWEGFAGISARNVRVRIYVSPDYLVDGRTSYYGEVNGRLARIGAWSLNGHAGMSVIPPDPGDTGMRYFYDGSVQVGRSFGRFSFGLGAATTNYPVFSEDRGPSFLQNKPRVFASISRSF